MHERWQLRESVVCEVPVGGSVWVMRIHRDNHLGVTKLTALLIDDGGMEDLGAVDSDITKFLSKGGPTIRLRRGQGFPSWIALRVCLFNRSHLNPNRMAPR